MKDTDKVASLIAELKSLAENDFELHRIAVLEKDLTAPLVVEIIDDTHQKFDGITYRKIRDGHYVATSLLHRAVYSYHYGNIPEKGSMHVHHIDKNPENNAIKNLKLMTNTEHRKLHETEDAKYTQKVCPICGKTFISRYNKKTCSDTCWKKSRGIMSKCQHCGKEFLKYLPEQNFCSIACSTAEMDKNREPIIAKCINCGKEFSATYEGALYCSKKCSNHYRYEHDRENRVCPICGKTFNVFTGADTKTCSPSCGAKLSHITRKKNLEHK